MQLDYYGYIKFFGVFVGTWVGAFTYQMPEKPFKIFEEDFTKTMMDYLMFKQGIDVKEFSDSLVKKVLYDSEISSKNNNVVISISGGDKKDETN